MSWQAQLDAFLAMSERDKCRLCEEEFHLAMDDWREGNGSKPVRILLTEWIAVREFNLRAKAICERGTVSGRTQHTQPNMQSLPGTGGKFVEDAMEGYCRNDVALTKTWFEMSYGWTQKRMIEWLLSRPNVKITYDETDVAFPCPVISGTIKLGEYGQACEPALGVTKKYVDNQQALALYRDGLASMRATFKNLGICPDGLLDDNGNYVEIEIKTYVGKV